MTHLLIKYGNIVLTTTIGLLTLYHLSLLFLVRLRGYIANLSDFYSYRLIGKLTDFLQLQDFTLRKHNVECSTTTARVSSILKNKVDLTLVKETPLRITLNLDGSPIISKSHTHPSHSQTSRLLTSSLETRLIDERFASVMGECATKLDAFFGTKKEKKACRGRR
jgi:hypothetical protein